MACLLTRMILLKSNELIALSLISESDSFIMVDPLVPVNNNIITRYLIVLIGYSLLYAPETNVTIYAGNPCSE